MNENELVLAIQSAKKEVPQYLEVVELAWQVDVSRDAHFQRRYNYFWKVRQRRTEWYACYYSLMEDCKKTPKSFAQVIDYLSATLSRYEPSFSSKLIATLDPKKPAWDVNVLRNTGLRAPSYSAANKVTMAKSVYISIEKWYEKFLKSPEGEFCVRKFDQLVPEHERISDVKKIDFVLWQMRK